MSNPRSFPFWTVASLSVALTGNLVAAALVVAPLYRLPPGSSVSLLGESSHAALASLATLLVADVLGLIAWRRERRHLAVVFILCLALTPFPFSGWAMRHVAENRGMLLKS